METNPDFPAVIGTQLTPRTNFQRGLYQPVSSSADCIMERLPSTATQTVTSVAKWFKNLTPLGNQPTVMVEFVPTGSEIPTGLASATYNPNASSQSGCTGTWADLNGGGAGSVYNTDVFNYGQIHLDFATAGVLAGKRIRRVRFVLDVQAISLGGAATIAVGFDGLSSVWQQSPVVLAQGDAGVAPLQRLTFDTGEVHPAGSVWTPALLQELDAGTARLDVFLNANAGYVVDDGSGGLVQLVNAYCMVDYCNENRVARDIVSVNLLPPDPNPVWSPWTPHKPDGTANLAKVNGTPLTVITRQPRRGDQYAAFNGISTQAAMLLVPLFTAAPTAMPGIILDSVLNADGTVASIGTVRRDLFTAMDMEVTGVMSVDAQPWAFPDDQDGASVTTRQQEFTQSSGGPITVAGVRLIGKYQPGPDGLVNDLTVRLRRRSDNVTVATATLTKAMADASEAIDTGYEHYLLLQVPWVAPFAMVTAVQYYVDLTSARPDDWAFPALRVSNLSSGPAQSWHGATDAATIGGEDTAYDYPWLLYQAIAVPADFTAMGVTVPVNPAADICDGRLTADCLVTGIGAVLLEWDVTALGGLFGYYEIQRQDQYGTWATVMIEPDESVAAFLDFEARLGLQSSYRIRVVTDVGVFGGWSATIVATAPVNGVGLTFTSNANPAGNVAYSDVFSDKAERVYLNPEANELVTHILAGRDYVVAFQPCERRGLSFDCTLLLNAMSTPSTVGVHAFDALRDLAKSGVPYVCVRNEDGDRWLVAMKVPDIHIAQPKDFYTATISCVEVQGEPTAVAA